MTSFSKQVAIRTEANADELKLGLHDAVDQDKVRLDMAIAESCIVPGKRMVVQIRRKRLFGAEKIDDGRNLMRIFSATHGTFVASHEFFSEYARKHGSQSSIASIALNISSVLSNGPYVGSVPAIMRSRTARVSALGMCSSSSGTCMGNGKPRCSRVCMSRMFMPVDVDMPSREKRLSARRLISGFTRNAIVAEFISNRFLLFDNSRQYSTFAFSVQAGDFNEGLWGDRLAA